MRDIAVRIWLRASSRSGETARTGGIGAAVAAEAEAAAEAAEAVAFPVLLLALFFTAAVGEGAL